MPSYGTPVANPYNLQQPQQRQVNADMTGGNGGFNFNFNSAAGGGMPLPPAPNYGGTSGGASSAPSGYTTFANQGDYAKFTQQEAQTRSQNEQAEKMLRLQSQYGLDAQRAAWNHQDQQANNILSNLSAVGTWGTNAPPMPRINVNYQNTGSNVPNVQHIQMPDFTAAQNAAFARAKDREGEMATGALTGLRSALGGRGLLGSGAEHRGTANIANRGLANMGEVNREQAIQNANANVDMMKTGYQGDITQRGQDISQAANMNSNNLNLAQLQLQADLAEREAVNRHNESGQNFMQNILLGLIRSGG